MINPIADLGSRFLSQMVTPSVLYKSLRARSPSPYRAPASVSWKTGNAVGQHLRPLSKPNNCEIGGRYPLDDMDTKTLREANPHAGSIVDMMKSNASLFANRAHVMQSLITLGGGSSDVSVGEFMGEPPKSSNVARKWPDQDTFSAAVNTMLPLREILRKNVRSYSINELVQDGIPADCSCVLVQVANASGSKMGKQNGDNSLLQEEENQDFIVLNKQKDEFVCCSFDRNNNDKQFLFKMNSDSLSKITALFLGGVVAIPSKTSETAE